MRTFGRNFWSDCDVGRLLFQSRWNLSEQKIKRKSTMIKFLEIALLYFKVKTKFLFSSFTVELKTTLTRIKEIEMKLRIIVWLDSVCKSKGQGHL